MFRTQFICALWVMLLSAGTLRAEIYVPKHPPTQRLAAEHDVAFRQKFLVDAYRVVGIKDAKWDDAVIAFLTQAPRALAKLAGGPSLETLLEQGQSIREKGCKDALVQYFTGQILVQLGRVPEAEALEKGLAQEMVKQKYPAMWQFTAAFLEYEIVRLEGKDKQANACVDIAVKAVPIMVSPQEYGKDHRAELFADLFAGEEFMPAKIRRQIWQAALETKDIDPLTALYLEALYENRAAVARNGIVAPEHYPRTVECYTKVWQADPTIPEVPTAMITIANRTISPEAARQWFERALKARVDYAPAYRAYIFSLYPRFGVDRRTLLEFGLECFDTRRFDTGVPLKFFDVLLATRKEWDNGDMSGWARAEVYDKVKEMLDRTTAADGAYPDDPYYRSLEAAFCVQTGHFEEAQKIVAGLHGVLRETATLLVNTTPQEVRGASAAYSGESAEAAIKAQALIADAKRKQAIEVYQAAAAKQQDPDGARFLRSIVQSNQWLDAFDNGKEVELKANDEFAGFHAQSSRWQADADGGFRLVGSTVPNPYLMCEADFGDHWEIKAKLDFVHKEADWDEAGFSLSSPGNSNFLGLIVSTKEKWLLPRTFNSVGTPAHAEVKDKANQLILRRDGLKIFVNVNGKAVYEGAAPEDDPAHRLRIGFCGFSVYKKDIVRFYDVTIRQTKEQK